MDVSLQHPILDAAVVVVSWLLPYWAGGEVLKLVFRDHELRRRWVQVLFACTFATSMNLLVLALYEILGVMEPAARWLTWRVVLVVLSVDLVRLLPIDRHYAIGSGDACAPPCRPRASRRLSWHRAPAPEPQ